MVVCKPLNNSSLPLSTLSYCSLLLFHMDTPLLPKHRGSFLWTGCVFCTGPCCSHCSLLHLTCLSTSHRTAEHRTNYHAEGKPGQNLKETLQYHSLYQKHTQQSVCMSESNKMFLWVFLVLNCFYKGSV